MSNHTSMQHDHVWDDSALLNTWDEAVAEYKKYHSLAAKGKTIPIDPPAEEAKPPQAAKPKKQKKQPHANGLVDASQASTGAQQEAWPELEPQVQASHDQPPQAAPIPTALLGTVQDEGMKNLMMSWYYAGYYTGLYEGKQTAYASMAGNG